MSKKEQFYKILNNIVGAERLTNEETYIINDYVSNLEAKIREAIEYIKDKYDDDLFDDTLTQFEDELLKILRGEQNEK